MNLKTVAIRDDAGRPAIVIQPPAMALDAMTILRTLRQQFPSEYQQVAREIIAPNGVNRLPVDGESGV